ncbi:MAG: hypothetical protein Athens071426_344 [Parcubacteria group bacterium Athens0714_26]|nr:MAG: hypothetical protein Athens071426_344 [Parcubacteria group bacterium Athens0714_26]
MKKKNQYVAPATKLRADTTQVVVAATHKGCSSTASRNKKG